jgi:hypothetical protein
MLGDSARRTGYGASAREHYEAALLERETLAFLFRGGFSTRIQTPLFADAADLARVVAKFASVSPDQPWAAAAAVRMFESLARSKNPSLNLLHDHANFLLHLAPEEHRDASKALAQARKAAEMTQYRDLRILQTLIVAASRAGDVPAALDAQQKLLDLRK